MHSSAAYSLVLMMANESHYLCISVLLCTGGLVWDCWAMRGCSSIRVYQSHTVFGLVLSLASAESPAWALSNSWLQGTQGLLPCTPMSLLSVDIDFVPSHSLYQAKNMSAILETPTTSNTENKQRRASTQYRHCDDNFLMAQSLAWALLLVCQ